MAGGARRAGRGCGAALFTNRPGEGCDKRSAYVDRTGSGLLRSLEPRPWLDAIYGLQLGAGLTLGAGLRYAYDVRDRGIDAASVARWDVRLGVAIDTGERRRDSTLRLEHVSLLQRSVGVSRHQTDCDGSVIHLLGRL